MDHTKNSSQPFFFAILLIVLAAITRLIPHPFNFTAVGAMALFAGANIRDRRYAFLLPVIVMFITDLILGFHFSILPVYACFAFTVWMGIKIRANQKPFIILSGSFISSLVFFLITNMPVWYLDLRLYPMSIQGFLDSYQMALPFFKNQLLGDIFYNTILFGVFHIVFRNHRTMQTEKIKKH